MTKYYVAPVIWREMDDGIVIVTPEEGRVRVLNEVGANLWRQLVEGHSVAELEAYLVANFHLSQAQAAADLTAFIDELLARNLIAES